MPGYIATMGNSRFKRLEYKIIIIGQDNGFIYGKYKTKEDFMNRIDKRRNTFITMMCYYKRPIVFTEYEMKMAWKYNIYPISESQVHKALTMDLTD